MAWRRPGDKPLSEAMMESLLTHICVTRPQWVKSPTTWLAVIQQLVQFRNTEYTKALHCWVESTGSSPQMGSNTEIFPYRKCQDYVMTCHDVTMILLQGWRYAYYICGGIGIGLGFIFLFTVKEPERQGSGSNNDAEIREFLGGEEVTLCKKVLVVLKSFANPSLVVVCIAGSIRNMGTYVQRILLLAWMCCVLFCCVYVIRLWNSRSYSQWLLYWYLGSHVFATMS